MDFTDLDHQVAAAAHRCWCKKMLEAGWRPGKIYDATAKTHDRLVPFEKLTAFDQSQARLWVEIEELVDRLAESMRFAMSQRELSANDIFVGMRVRIGDPERLEFGRIVSWDIADKATGSLEMILVEMDDGSVLDFIPAEGMLIPVDEQ
jgi:hypothetical protein